MASAGAVTWRAALERKEAQMQASLQSGSGWMHRFQAQQGQQQQQQAHQQLLDDTRARLRQGERPQQLWRQINEVLGEDVDPAELARHGWQLHRQASQIRAASTSSSSSSSSAASSSSTSRNRKKKQPPQATQMPLERTSSDLSDEAIMSSTHFALHTAQQDSSEDEDLDEESAQQVARLARNSSTYGSSSASSDWRPEGFQPMSLDPPQSSWQQSFSQTSFGDLGAAADANGAAAAAPVDMSLDPNAFWQNDQRFSISDMNHNQQSDMAAAAAQQQQRQQYADPSLHNATAHLKRALSRGYTRWGLGGQQSDNWDAVAAVAAAHADSAWPDDTKRLRNL